MFLKIYFNRYNIWMKSHIVYSKLDNCICNLLPCSKQLTECLELIHVYLNWWWIASPVISAQLPSRLLLYVGQDMANCYMHFQGKGQIYLSQTVYQHVSNLYLEMEEEIKVYLHYIHQNQLPEKHLEASQNYSSSIIQIEASTKKQSKFRQLSHKNMQIRQRYSYSVCLKYLNFYNSFTLDKLKAIKVVIFHILKMKICIDLYIIF